MKPITIAARPVQPCLTNSHSYDLLNCDALRCEYAMFAACRERIAAAKDKAAQRAREEAERPKRNEHGLGDCVKCVQRIYNGVTIGCKLGHFAGQTYSMRTGTYAMLKAKYAWCVDYEEIV